MGDLKSIMLTFGSPSLFWSQLNTEGFCFVSVHYKRDLPFGQIPFM